MGGGRRGVMPGTCNPRRLKQKDLHECDKINKLGVGSQWSHPERMGVLALDRDWVGGGRLSGGLRFTSSSSKD